MPKTWQCILASLYVGLMLVGIISVMAKAFHGTFANVFMIILIPVTVGYLIVLRKEEDEELKSN